MAERTIKFRKAGIAIALIMLGALLQISSAQAQETPPPPIEEETPPPPVEEYVSPPDTQFPILDDYVQKGVLQLNPETDEQKWQVGKLETYGIKFIIRSKEALTWALSIHDGGFHNPAIESSHAKVLTIVNSLFVLGLLAIAGIAMFSAFLPKRKLKKVALVYGAVVIFVNFALPFNQLLIDGTDILQKALLTNEEGEIKISNIIQTPSYENGIGFQKIMEEDTNMENRIFVFVILLASGIAYFLIALIFLIRIVILWGLLILSPLLLLLAIFKTTRGWFINWLGIYGRWLLIGPLIALGLSLVVNIWQVTGLPVETNVISDETFMEERLNNIAFYLPGKTTPNTLSNTNEMMEYILFLIMLYLPIFFAFALTKQKTLNTLSNLVVEKLNGVAQAERQPIIIRESKAEEKTERGSGIFNEFKNKFGDKIAKIAELAMPSHSEPRTIKTISQKLEPKEILEATKDDKNNNKSQT